MGVRSWVAEDAHLACEMSMDVAGQCGAEIDVEQDVPARCWDEQVPVVASPWMVAKEPARGEPAEPSEPQSHGERVPSGSRDEQVLVATAASQIEVHGDYWWSFP